MAPVSHALGDGRVRGGGAGVEHRDDTAPRTRVLYVSYDGALEPLGESQVVAYVERLSQRNEIVLLSFEKREDSDDAERMRSLRARLAGRAITWIPLRYHKWPSVLASAYDVVHGIGVSVQLVRSRGLRLVHARGYVAALIAVALQRLLGTKFLFDMRGIWADEKVDAGHWSRGSAVYRITKWWERRFFESADAIVSLTEAGLTAVASLGYRLRPGIPITVIPTCTDLQRFAPGPKNRELLSRLGLNGYSVIGCVGTLSNWYLREPMLDCLAYLVRRRPGVKILIVTREDHEQVRRDARRAGLDDGALVVVRVPFADMPEYMRLIDVGLFFIKPSFSKKASSATKLGEFLASGVPVVINEGVGDSAAIVRALDAGVVLPGLGVVEFEACLSRVDQLLADPSVSTRCRRTAERYFDLVTGVEKYAALYARIDGQHRADCAPAALR